MIKKKLMEQIVDKEKRQKAYDEHLKIAEQKNIAELDKLIEFVNEILEKHGITDKIEKCHIRFNADYIGNINHIADKKLSELIFEKIYPTPTRKKFCHYTNFHSGKSIIENSEFWLFNLNKNFEDQEFRLFTRNTK